MAEATAAGSAGDPHAGADTGLDTTNDAAPRNIAVFIAIPLRRTYFLLHLRAFRKGPSRLAATGRATQIVAMAASQPKDDNRKVLRATLGGAAIGVLVELPALAAAVASSGAGHGDYVAARALFPIPMLLTRIAGPIGWPGVALALVQFPLYGALLGWSRSQRNPNPLIVLVGLHVLAALACFSGMIFDFR